MQRPFSRASRTETAETSLDIFCFAN